MMKFVVRSQCWQCTHSDTIGKENLSGSINPSFAIEKFIPIHFNVVPKTFSSTRKSDSANEQNRHHEVGEKGSEPDNLKKATRYKWRTTPPCEIFTLWARIQRPQFHGEGLAFLWSLKHQIGWDPASPKLELRYWRTKREMFSSSDTISFSLNSQRSLSIFMLISSAKELSKRCTSELCHICFFLNGLLRGEQMHI